jgi:hypothetical protein
MYNKDCMLIGSLAKLHLLKHASTKTLHWAMSGGTDVIGFPPKLTLDNDFKRPNRGETVAILLSWNKKLVRVVIRQGNSSITLNRLKETFSFDNLVQKDIA